MMKPEMMKVIRIASLFSVIVIAPVYAQQQPTATQILGQQAAALLTQNAELIERIGKLQADLAAVTKERDELKAKQPQEPAQK